MARARNIKPGFFRNADLIELPPLVRILFAGLWTLADREGRIHDRPKQIKMDVLPGDDLDVDAALNDLQKAGFVLRYEVDGKRVLMVLNFSKHQNPHCKEPASELPPPNAHRASTVQARCTTDAVTESTGLIPDSGFLIPDSIPLSGDSAPASPPPTTTEAAPPEPTEDLPAKKPRAARSPAFDGKAWLTDRGVSEQVARDWLAVRAAKKAAPTQTAFEGVEAEAIKAGISLADAVAVCCKRSWVGFNARWDRGDGPTQPGAPPGGRPPTLTETRTATIAALTRTTSHERPDRSTERDITGEAERVA